MTVSHYSDRVAVLATMHGKQRALAWPLRRSLGLSLIVPPALDTDALGAFSGEIPRTGTPQETALQKARMGMAVAGLPLGLANEGSFGPHPALPLVPCDHEVLAFVDDENGFSLIETILGTKTNSARALCSTVEQAFAFAQTAGFPAHALIVRPVSNADPALIKKGLHENAALSSAVERAIQASPERAASVETDMRAHCNPTRMRTIRGLAAKLARRLRTICPACGCPGFGKSGGERGLPCTECGCPTDLMLKNLHECARCGERQHRPRSDGLKHAPAKYCPNCNP